jgi:hypothetical protein
MLLALGGCGALEVGIGRVSLLAGHDARKRLSRDGRVSDERVMFE